MSVNLTKTWMKGFTGRMDEVEERTQGTSYITLRKTMININKTPEKSIFSNSRFFWKATQSLNKETEEESQIKNKKYFKPNYRKILSKYKETHLYPVARGIRNN